MVDCCIIQKINQIQTDLAENKQTVDGLMEWAALKGHMGTGGRSGTRAQGARTPRGQNPRDPFEEWIMSKLPEKLKEMVDFFKLNLPIPPSKEDDRLQWNIYLKKVDEAQIRNGWPDNHSTAGAWWMSLPKECTEAMPVPQMNEDMTMSRLNHFLLHYNGIPNQEIDLAKEKDYFVIDPDKSLFKQYMIYCQAMNLPLSHETAEEFAGKLSATSIHREWITHCWQNQAEWRSNPEIVFSTFDTNLPSIRQKMKDKERENAMKSQMTRQNRAGMFRLNTQGEEYKKTLQEMEGQEVCPVCLERVPHTLKECPLMVELRKENPNFKIMTNKKEGYEWCDYHGWSPSHGTSKCTNIIRKRNNPNYCPPPKNLKRKRGQEFDKKTKKVFAQIAKAEFEKFQQKAEKAHAENSDNEDDEKLSSNKKAPKKK